MRRGIGRLRAGGSGSGTDSDAAAWAAAVTSAGGTYSAATLAAVSAFCVSAKASNYWTKLNRINLFCGNQLAAALVPLKVGGGSATDTNVNFVSGDYTEATGLTGNGSTKYLDTGLLADALTVNDTHLSVYNRSGAAAGAGRHIGATGAAAQNFYMYAPFTDAKTYSAQYNTELGSSVLSTPFGFIVASRTASNAHSIYRNAVSVGSEAVTAGTPPTRAVFVFASNGAGTAGSFTSHVLASYSIGSGLSAADVAAYNTHMQAFQTALSRNV